MKKRIQIDSAILSLVVILTGLLYQFPQLYSTGPGWDNFFDFFGIITILKGSFIRMVGRGHKKAHSKKGHGLVSTGFYQYTRNPMYLGSFTLGCGFILIVWPWWSLPLFALLFYLRFKKQVVKEEAHLKKLFGKTYEEYCRKTPRVFPSIKGLWKARKKVSVIMPWEEACSTSEKYGLIGWPALALLLETFQQMIVYKYVDIFQTIGVFVVGMAVFAAGLWYRYQQK